MTVEELKDDRDAQAAIRAFVSNENFEKIVLAFVMHTPSTDNGTPDQISMAHGKNMGTRYVFSQMEKIAKSAPETQPNEKHQGRRDRRITTDPDLKT